MPEGNVSIKFNPGKILFDENFPIELDEFMEREEFDAVIRTINTELATKVQIKNESLQKFSKIVNRTLIILVGFLISPILLMKLASQRKSMAQYWEKVKEFLDRENRKTYMKRGVEWKVEIDKSKMAGRDVVNPLVSNMITVYFDSAKRKIQTTIPSKQLPKIIEAKSMPLARSKRVSIARLTDIVEFDETSIS